MSKMRTEKDSMGQMEVPAQALYGASTQRAVLNFPISGTKLDGQLIHAYGLIKWSAAKANAELGKISAEKAELISRAAEEVYHGKLDEHFVVDVFQTGSGTSTNTNVNEVIANRCSEICGKSIGSHDPVHPNDHVNMGQSSNDTFPTAMHIAVGCALKNDLEPSLERLHLALDKKSQEFDNILKIGRTHLMDATPIRLGQEFGGFAKQLERGIDRVNKATKALHELALGGTAVGTGLNCHPDFPEKAISFIAEKAKIPFREAENHFEAQAAKDSLVEASGHLKTIAVSLFKIANDIRLLGSGPRCGIGEIQLPPTQPGSSIMPGKVNPVMCESVVQVCARVVGNDTTTNWCGANGHLELNVLMPVMAQSILESIRLLANVSDIFSTRCVDGIVANEDRCRELIEYSMSMVTSLAPIIGYDRAAEIAKESVKTGKTVRQICEELKVLPPGELFEALDPVQMTHPSP